MTGKKVKSGTIDVKALLAGDEEFLRALVRTALEEVLEAEMTEALGILLLGGNGDARRAQAGLTLTPRQVPERAREGGRATDGLNEIGRAHV